MQTIEETKEPDAVTRPIGKRFVGKNDEKK